MMTNCLGVFIILAFICAVASSLKCFQCGGLSGLPCKDFDVNKIKYQKVCNDTVQSCMTSFLEGEVNFRDCWSNKVQTDHCDGHNAYTICMCANSNFCNCHNNKNLNGERCPIPPSSAHELRPQKTVLSVVIVLSLAATTIATSVCMA